jgi:hypothetical protein
LKMTMTKSRSSSKNMSSKYPKGNPDSNSPRTHQVS